MKRFLILLSGLMLSVLTFASVLDDRFTAAFGPLFHPAAHVPPLVGPRNGLDSLHRWNLVAINASGLDHTPVAPGENRVFGEQLGPGRSSRAMAIVRIAMFDALDAVVGGYTSYTGTHASPGPMSVDAAIAQAARDTLAALFPSQTAAFDNYLAQDLAAVGNENQKTNGIDLGHRAAAAILAMRLNDGSQIPEPRVGIDYFPSDLPGHWRQDPISLIPLALGEQHPIRTPARPGKRRHGRRRNDHLGIEILLRFLASDYRHSRIGPGHRPHRFGRRQFRHGWRSIL